MAWTNDGGDHDGADWTVSDSTTINGVHTGVGVFTIESGYIYYGSNASLEVHCARAKIIGYLLKSVKTPVYNVTIYAQQRVEVPGGIGTMLSGSNGSTSWGYQASQGAPGGGPNEPPAGNPPCSNGIDGTDREQGGQGDPGADRSGVTAEHGEDGGDAGFIYIDAPRVTFNSLSACGGTGGSGGDCYGNQGGPGGQGGTGQDGGDANCSGGCGGTPYTGGAGAMGGTGGTGGTGSDGCTGGNGGKGGNGNDIDLIFAAPESIYLGEGSTNTTEGSGGWGGHSIAGSGGEGGPGGSPGVGGAGCNGGANGSGGITGPTGATGAAGSPGTDGSYGADGDTSGVYSKAATKVIDGRKLWQTSGYYGQRMRCNLIVNDSI